MKCGCEGRNYSIRARCIFRAEPSNSWYAGLMFRRDVVQERQERPLSSY